MKKRQIRMAIFFSIIIVATISTTVHNQTKVAKEESIEKGRKLYTQLCLDCHGETGEGEGALIGTSFNNQQFLSTFSDNDLKNMIENGRPQALMPAYRFLEDEEKANIVSLIRSWQTKPLTFKAPSKITGNADNGKQLYAANCMTCHGQTGSGFSTAAAAIANPDTLKQITDKQMWLSIAYGRDGTRMGPSLKGENGVKQLGEQDISDIVIYIRTDLANTYNPLETKSE